jgi:hypothetical protein
MSRWGKGEGGLAVVRERKRGRKKRKGKKERGDDGGFFKW